MACLVNRPQPKARTALPGMTCTMPYTTRLAMPDAMTLRLDFTGHDRILGAAPLACPARSVCSALAASL